MQVVHTLLEFVMRSGILGLCGRSLGGTKKESTTSRTRCQYLLL